MNINNSDLLVDLPTDKNQPTYSELKVIDSLFIETTRSNIHIISQYLILAILIIVFYYIPNTTVIQFLPQALSSYEFAPIFIKALCISILFFIIQKYYITIIV